VSQQIADEKKSCYKHASRQTSLLCNRCGRAICWECLVDAPVGFQCRKCTSRKLKPSGAAGKLHRRNRLKRGLGKVAKTVIVLALIAAAISTYRHAQKAAATGGPAAGAAAGVPLPVPGSVEDPAGFKFLEVDAHTGAPIRFNPCHTIEYVVNPDGAPPGGLTAVNAAVDQVSKASGIAFSSVGITSERSLAGRPIYQPSLYGNKWAPILIEWMPLGKASGTGHGFAGVGGPSRQVPSGTTQVYVSGKVLMNSDDVEPPELLEGILMHELGHVLGLDHVTNPGDVMNPAANIIPNQQWGPGDLAGLQKVGKAAGCLAEPKPSGA
jgi:hypothetical protein